MVFYGQKVENSNITLKYLVKYVKKYTQYVPIKMLTVILSLYPDIKKLISLLIRIFAFLLDDY